MTSTMDNFQLQAEGYYNCDVRVGDARSVKELGKEECLVRKSFVRTSVGSRHVRDNHLKPSQVLEPAMPRPESIEQEFPFQHANIKTQSTTYLNQVVSQSVVMIKEQRSSPRDRYYGEKF